MKALSIKEPWATLITRYGKDIENRSWISLYKGPLVICASKSVDLEKDNRASGNCYQEDWENVWYCLDRLAIAGLPEQFSDLNINPGHAIGIVWMEGCTQAYRGPWSEMGQYHYILGNACAFQHPIPVRGTLGLWDFDISRLHKDDLDYLAGSMIYGRAVVNELNKQKGIVVNE